ncbi:type IV secretion system protein [Variovorax sp. J22P240]|uniref:type IV secretion system protein n=1 Tax=Variovorax sp. J22P240 TaxID=3053514 RepID=UPI002575A8C3|nr:type IV secretion system protein [Variovorax sp. J22P240]MDL9998463.1 type IV secretion system protein [Variovorax sp. J22P240]
MTTSIGDFVYFALIYKWLSERIAQFGSDVMARTMVWVSAMAMILVTLWVLIQGYRMITGQSREPMMAIVSSMGKIAVVVSVASTMSLGSIQLQDFFTSGLAREISRLVTGSDSSPASIIDKNLAYTQLAMGAIDAVYVPIGDLATADEKARTMLIATLGTAGPAMAAGAMLLLYQLAMALFIGFGPLFILCLIFDQTKELFRRWLMHGLGTLFSLAVLNFVVSLVLEMTLRVAGALWGTEVISRITGQGAEGFSSQAMQQGGVGLLMTALIISTPPMAAMFFNGTMGNFMFQSAFSGGGGARMGSQGQLMQGGGYGGNAPPTNTQQLNAGDKGVDTSRLNSASHRSNGVTAPSDTVKPYQGGPGVRA